MSSGDSDDLRLHIDGERCRGHGICALLLAEHVDLDDWGYAVLDQAAVNSRRSARRARRAVRACPQQALHLRPAVEKLGGPQV